MALKREDYLRRGDFITLPEAWEKREFGAFDCRIKDLVEAPDPLRREGVALFAEFHGREARHET